MEAVLVARKVFYAKFLHVDLLRKPAQQSSHDGVCTISSSRLCTSIVLATPKPKVRSYVGAMVVNVIKESQNSIAVKAYPFFG